MYVHQTLIAIVGMAVGKSQLSQKTVASKDSTLQMIQDFHGTLISSLFRIKKVFYGMVNSANLELRIGSLQQKRCAEELIILD